MQTNYKGIILNTLISAIITFLTGIIMGKFSIPNADVRIGNIVSINDSEYQFNIDISNNYDKNIKNLKLSFPANIELTDIRTNKYIDISKSNINININNNSSFNIKNISSNENITLIINSNRKVNIEDITVSSDNCKIRKIYTYKEKSFFTKYLFITISFTTIVIIINTTFNIIAQ